MPADSNAFGCPSSRTPGAREACPEPVEWVGTFAKPRGKVEKISHREYKLPEAGR
jgi:hypothetical protein